MLWIHLRKLRGADGAARARAAHALAERGNAKAVEPLGTALADRQWPDRWTAAVALGRLGNGRAVPFLQQALSEDDEVDVRCNAAWALGRIGGNAAVEPLAAALADNDDAVRRSAAEALAEVRGGAAAQALQGALGDDHHDVRLAAIKGLGAIGSGREAAHFLAALHDDEWSVRTAAAEALGELDDSSAVPPLLEALRTDGLEARLAAAEALGRIGDPRAIEDLGAALGDELEHCDLRLRRNVAKALGDIGKAGGAGPLLRLVVDAYTAGVALDSLVRVVRADAASLDREPLQALAELDDIEQVPWMIDEAAEAAGGGTNVRRGRPWRVDASDLRVLALAEVRRREDESGV